MFTEHTRYLKTLCRAQHWNASMQYDAKSLSANSYFKYSATLNGGYSVCCQICLLLIFASRSNTVHVVQKTQDLHSTVESKRYFDNGGSFGHLQIQTVCEKCRPECRDLTFYDRLHFVTTAWYKRGFGHLQIRYFTYHNSTLAEYK